MVVETTDDVLSGSKIGAPLGLDVDGATDVIDLGNSTN